MSLTTRTARCQHAALFAGLDRAPADIAHLKLSHVLGVVQLTAQFSADNKVAPHGVHHGRAHAGFCRSTGRPTYTWRVEPYTVPQSGHSSSRPARRGAHQHVSATTRSSRPWGVMFQRSADRTVEEAGIESSFASYRARGRRQPPWRSLHPTPLDGRGCRGASLAGGEADPRGDRSGAACFRNRRPSGTARTFP
jgi:hypothetical protein